MHLSHPITHPALIDAAIGMALIAMELTLTGWPDAVQACRDDLSVDLARASVSRATWLQTLGAYDDTVASLNPAN
jgi:hypothetical protein